MFTMPAIACHGGSFYRGVTVGVCAGLFFGALAWLDSGMLVAGAIVFIVVGVGSGVWMARRMARSWPGRGGKGKPVTGRPSLRIGQHGKIARKYLGGGCGWRSVCFATPML